MGRRDHDANQTPAADGLQGEGAREPEVPSAPFSWGETFNPDNPAVRTILGRKGRRTWAAILPAAWFLLAPWALFAAWIWAVMLHRGAGQSGPVIEVALSMIGYIAAVPLWIGPTAAVWSRHRLERDPILSELLLSRLASRDFVAPLRGLAILWTGVAAGAALVLATTLCVALFFFPRLPDGPAVLVAGILRIAAALAAAFNYIAGFHARFAMVSASPIAPIFVAGSTTLLATASLLARVALYAALWAALREIAFAGVALVECWLAIRRLQMGEQAWASAELDLRERLADAVAERDGT